MRHVSATAQKFGTVKKTERKIEKDAPQMPFNEALKLVWASPPQPKIAKKKVGSRAKRKTGP
jgi:hypothetical protein